MTPRRYLFLLGLAATLAPPMSLRAGVALAPAKSSYVVIVGVGEFTDPAISARPTAEADARALYDLFVDPAFHDDPDRVRLLSAKPDDKRKSQPATRENIVKALHEAVAKTAKDETIIVAMFGRGASSGDQTCFFTSETQFKERAKTGLLGSDLDTEFKLAKDRKICLMLDIAFKGGFDAGKETLAEPTLRDVLGAVFGSDDKGEQAPPQNKVVILATVPSSPPLAVGENGLFARTVLTAFQGAADTDGYEPDGLVVVDELVKYLEKTMPEQSRKIGKTTAEKESTPFIVGEETSHFALTKNPKVTPKVVERVAVLDSLGKSSTLTPEMVTEGKALVARMPKLKAQQELRKQYQQLADKAVTPEAFVASRNTILEGMVLPVADAEKFAQTMLRAIDTVKTEYVKPLDAGEWAALSVKGLYRRLEQAVPADVLEQIQSPKGMERSAITALFKDVRKRIGKREDIDGVKDADTAIQMMFAELKDPYTTYYDAATIAKMDAPLRGEFRGVGIQIRRDLVRDGLLVVSPIKGSPAYKAGIQAGDLITKIKRETDAQGKPLADGVPREVSTQGMKTEAALELILGKIGVPVTLEVERDGVAKDYALKRDVITVETVLGVKRDANDDWEFFIDPESKIGYVCLTQFSPGTAKDLANAVTKLRAAGMKGMVLDLRNNPGGFLTAAVSICNMFLDDAEGVIVSVKYRARETEVWRSEGKAKKFVNFPMAVLVNGQSASASEIVSACLQDYNRAVVVGERSYGKGSVQNVKPFAPTGGEIKFTTARYFPPTDRNIDKNSTPGKPEDIWGVTPDKGYLVKLSREQAQDFAEQYRDREVIKPRDGTAKESKAFKDTQLDKAVEYLREQVKAVADRPAKKAG